MATVTGVIRYRDRSMVSSEGLVDTFNEIHSLILQSGMIQVADDEYNNQAGYYSTTGEAGTTKIVAKTSVSSYNINNLGVNVYRHPSLNFYVIVTAEQFIYKTSHSFCGVLYRVATKLKDGSYDSSRTSTFLRHYYYEKLFNQSSMSFSQLTGRLVPITVSCGPDHFWISSKGGFSTYQGANRYAAFPHPTVDPFSIGVFSSSINPSVLLVITPQEGYDMESTGLYGDSLYALNDISAVRYESFDGALWSRESNGCAGYTIDPLKSNTERGVRVNQAEVILNGKPHRFNFGFISKGVVAEFSEFQLNLNGVNGIYKSLPSIGSAGPAVSDSTSSNMSTVIFPVVTE